MNFKFCDAHLHLIPSKKATEFAFPLKHSFCTCAHSKEEFLEQEKECAKMCGAFSVPQGVEAVCVVQAFGLHPQMPLLENADFLRELLLQKRIGAIGEAGFDFFTDEFRQNAATQEKAWGVQLELAAQFNVPLIVHVRKATQKIFEYSQELKKLPSVVMHSFAGSEQDARSILERGINAYFSFGKPIMNNAKKAIACVKQLPLERLLFETDAPYQTLKGERATTPRDIEEVYQCAYELRCLNAKTIPFAEFCEVIKRNFNHSLFTINASAYCLCSLLTATAH